jgi:hypothetical protein
MKTTRFIYVLLLGLVSGGALLLPLKAQSPFDPGFNSTAERIREHLNVFTDRSMYAIGESLRFRADHFLNVDIQEDWSTVLYAELITPDGTDVVQGKFPLKNGVSTGSLHIPSGLLTGNYYLKCYTRWMRNAGPASFSYLPLKIINPNRMEVVNGTNGNGNGTGSNLTSVAYHQGEFSCATDASGYSRGGDVNLEIEGPYNAYVDEFRCCVSVVPAGAVDTISGQLLLSPEGTDHSDFSISYLPDMGSGPSLSGSVVYSDQSPASFTGLQFSLLGEHPGFFATVTDDYGRFAISMPDLYGTQELYVSPESKEGAQLEVRIDQDFDASPFHLPAVKFSLSEWEREVATRMSLAMQFSRVYGTVAAEQEDTSMSGFLPFYGTKVYSLNMDDYVNLPTLEEVFINLVPDVDVVRKKGKSSIRITSENSGIGIYPPLILIDHISVYDQGAMLALPPEKIDRIDVINEVYLKGSVTFGGLVAIYSKAGDMAGIDLPRGAYFFDYQTFKTEAEDYVAKPLPGDRIPDLRNTVLWVEDLTVRKDAPAKLRFSAPTTPGSYVILVRGIAPDGELWSASSQFSVE